MVNEQAYEHIALGRWWPIGGKKYSVIGSCSIHQGRISLSVCGTHAAVKRFCDKALLSDVVAGESPWGGATVTLHGLTRASGPSRATFSAISGADLGANFAFKGRTVFDPRGNKITTINSRYDDLLSVVYETMVNYPEGVFNYDSGTVIEFSPSVQVGNYDIPDINASLFLKFWVGQVEIGMHSFEYKSFPMFGVKFNNGIGEIGRAINHFVNAENIIRSLLGIMVRKSGSYNVSMKEKNGYNSFITYNLGGDINLSGKGVSPHDSGFHPNDFNEFSEGLKRMCLEYNKNLEINHDFSQSLAPGRTYSLERAAQICRCFEGMMALTHRSEGLSAAFRKLKEGDNKEIIGSFPDFDLLENYAKSLRLYWAHGTMKHKPPRKVFDQIVQITEKMITLCHALQLKHVGIDFLRSHKAGFRRAGFRTNQRILE